MSIYTLKHDRVEQFRDVGGSPGMRRIFIVGASGVGKSTLWGALRSEAPRATFAFPVRLVSRPQRPDDDSEENRHLDVSEFDPWFQRRWLDFYWSKPLPTGAEHYGFQPCRAVAVVYGCNDDFVLNQDSIHFHENLRAHGLLVQVTCSAVERARRLSARYSSVAVPAAELEYRLRDTGTAVRDASDIVVQSEDGSVLSLARDLLRLVGSSEWS